MALPVAVNAAAGVPLAVQLKEQVRWLIALGELRPGDRLPPVQELAEGLRINRNTVAQAYADLAAEGFLVARQGQGTFVADSEAVRRAVQQAALAHLVDDALERARTLGYTPDEFARAARARAAVQQALRRQRRALFVECTWPEVERHTRQLAEELGITIDGVHLDDLRRDREGFRRRAREVDLVITTLFHAEEVERIAGPEVEVVAVGAGFELHFLRALAQLPRGSRVCIACLDRGRATRMRRLLVDAGVHHLDLEPVGLDEERLAQVLRQSDAVFVSQAAYQEAPHLFRGPKVLTYQLILDRAGIEMLKARLAEREAALLRRRRSRGR